MSQPIPEAVRQEMILDSRRMERCWRRSYPADVLMQLILDFRERYGAAHSLELVRHLSTMPIPTDDDEKAT